MLSLSDVAGNPEVRHYLDRADSVLDSIGYTEHGRRHAGVTARRAKSLMEALDRPERQCELAGIAAYLHDIGNIVNRHDHAQSGATIAHHLLADAGMSIEETIEIVTAIGHHHETDGDPVSDISAAVILADKSDVHRSRVREKAVIQLDIHDRVNYAVTHSALRVTGPNVDTEMEGEREDGVKPFEHGPDVASVTIADYEEGDSVPVRPVITLSLTIDTQISPVREYFEIFLPRMLLSNRAADRLGAVYKLVINETPLL